MGKIKHIAIASQNPDATASFYKTAFGLKEIAKINSLGATGYHLSDGDINLAILKFKNDEVAGVPEGKEYAGLHHIGFEVESIEETGRKLNECGSVCREEINRVLGIGHAEGRRVNVEVKYGAPDGVIIDISETGWAGTARHPR